MIHRMAVGFAAAFVLASSPSLAQYGVTNIFEPNPNPGAQGYCFAIGEDDTVYVSYPSEGAVFALRDPGTPGGAIVEASYGAALPLGIDLDSAGNVYAATIQGVTKITPGVGSDLLFFVAPGPGFFFGEGLRVDASENVYVTSDSQKTVLKIPADGSSPSIVLGPGQGVLAPSDLAFGADGSVFVTGGGLARIRPDGTVQDLSPVVGRPLSSGGIEVDSQGRLIVGTVRLTPDNPDWTSVTEDGFTGPNGPPPGPNRVVNSMIDDQDDVYIVEMRGPPFPSSVWRLAADGTATRLLDGSGDGTNLFHYGLGVAVNSLGYVYATSENFDGLADDGAEVFRICPDPDGDGFCSPADNCTEVYNPTQFDADLDGYGNACDADFNQDGAYALPDVPVFNVCYLQTLPGSGLPDDPDCSESDFNDDGGVGLPDFLLLPPFGSPPGPSGLDCALSPPVEDSCQ